MTTISPTAAALTHPQAVYVDELRRLLAFIADARRREDAAYMRWEAATTPIHRNGARTDYLRTYDEVDALHADFDRLWARRVSFFTGAALASLSLLTLF